MDKLNGWIGRDPAMDRAMSRTAQVLWTLEEGGAEPSVGMRELKRATRALWSAVASRRRKFEVDSSVEDAVRNLMVACGELEYLMRDAGAKPDFRRVHGAFTDVLRAHRDDVRSEQQALADEILGSRLH